MKATERPWILTRGGNAHFSIEASARTVAFVATAKGDAEANGRLIVRAVNEYEAHEAVERAAREALTCLTIVNHSGEFDWTDEADALEGALQALDDVRRTGGSNG